jgi:hypothetical protein
MRKFVSSLLFAVLALAAFSPAHAQVQTDLAIDRAQLQSDYQSIVALNLNITDEQGKTFWPLYREYRGEIQKWATAWSISCSTTRRGRFDDR